MTVGRFKSILVDVDATARAHPALERAAALARASGARLTLVDVLHVPPEARRHLPSGAEQALMDDRQSRLTACAAGARDVLAGVKVLQGRPAAALIEEVVSSGHDLVVRAHARDLAAPYRPYGAIDMQLFRKCPCPVWAVGPGAPPAAPAILVAAHAAAEDEAEQRLNVKLVELALQLRAVQHGSLTLFQAWTAFGEELIRGRYSPEEIAAYVRHAEAASRETLAALRDRCGAGDLRLEIRKGHPEDVIPSFVVAEGIDTVVMGTVARTGVAGVLIGNTAERLLQRLPCSVMAVKPDDFVPPAAAS